MANEVYGILNSNAHHVSGETYQTVAHDEESFLRDVIAPIYGVLFKVKIVFKVSYYSTLAISITVIYLEI